MAKGYGIKYGAIGNNLSKVLKICWEHIRNMMMMTNIENLV
jgi:hypothetical protein